ncbi:hypothetical protein HYFRA_00001680 [Hymenoscyphus fraxineus]|uniref:F-box domain-containing protein n=1 Tax=Hymenoscyphus fraxineus TaxID=746836 RepID=A0A9N9L850_9HELO|nr:hypothetical protein HYFRA_00001680 [Hymenoscyphus fraxineus]
MPPRKHPPPETTLSIHKLPPEILHQICSILPLHDLGNFRLTCKAFGEFSQRHLVKELHVMFTQKSFANLHAISRNNQLRRYVRNIVYEPMMLSEIDKEGWMGQLQDYFSDWDRDRYIRFGTSKIGVGCKNGSIREQASTTKRLQGTWRVYDRKLMEQSHFLEGSQDYAIFKSALAKFPVLEQVIMKGRPNVKKSPWLEREYEDTMAIPAHFTDGRVDHCDESSVRPMMGLLSGLATAGNHGVQLKHFKIKKLGWQFFDYALDSDNRSSPEYTVWFGLRTLQIHFAEDFDAADIPEESCQRHRNLGALLSVMPLLETLDLRFGRPTRNHYLVHQEREYRYPVLFSNTLSNRYWPKLHTLRLEDVTCHVKAISSFLINHSRTLRVLNLSSIWLHEATSDWSFVFEIMRDHLSLSKLFLDGNFGGEDTPDNSEPAILMLLERRHTIWLTKAIVYGKEKMEKIRQENEDSFKEEVETLSDKRDRGLPVMNGHTLHSSGTGVEVVRGDFSECCDGVCPHKYFMKDPVMDLLHYTGRESWPE